VVAVCRSEQGEYLGATALVFDGITHPGCLEAMACREALELAADLQTARIHVASDCMEVIQALRVPYMGVFGSILHEVKAKAQQVQVLFTHEGLECNKETHALARFASSLPVGRHSGLLAPPVGLNLHNIVF
jgi:ribonuclease HI